MAALEVRRIEVGDDAELADWHATMRAGWTAGRRFPVVETLPALTGSVRTHNPDRDRELWAARDGGRVVGVMQLVLQLNDNQHLAELEIDVPPEHRRQGVGQALWEAAQRRCAEDSRTTLLGEVNVPSGTDAEQDPGCRFATARGFERVHTEQHLLLELPVRRATVAPHEGYELLGWTGACPEEHLAAYAGLFEQMGRDVPIGGVDWQPPTVTPDDLRRKEARWAMQGWDMLTAAARSTASGELAAYSLLAVNRNDPAEALQDDTFVLSAHRGHRLGSALKEANLALLQDQFPTTRRIHTWTAVDNAPMLHVNEGFGFRPVEEMHEFQRKG